MPWRYRTPEGDISSPMPSRETAKVEAVKFSWVRAFASAGVHADFGTPNLDAAEAEFAQLAASGWSVFEERA